MNTIANHGRRHEILIRDRRWFGGPGVSNGVEGDLLLFADRREELGADNALECEWPGGRRHGDRLKLPGVGGVIRRCLVRPARGVEHLERTLGRTGCPIGEQPVVRRDEAMWITTCWWHQVIVGASADSYQAVGDKSRQAADSDQSRIGCRRQSRYPDCISRSQSDGRTREGGFGLCSSIHLGLNRAASPTWSTTTRRPPPRRECPTPAIWSQAPLSASTPSGAVPLTVLAAGRAFVRERCRHRPPWPRRSARRA